MTPSSSVRPPDPGKLVDRARAFIAEYGLFSRCETVLVAVSGGVDSRALLDILGQLDTGTRPRLVVGHVDHGLRPESSGDARFVELVADELSLPWRVVRVDVPTYAKKYRLGLEHAARALRYQALGAIASEYAGPVIATGHTSDDSAESVLIHLLRGAGPDGLRGIAPRQAISVPALAPVELDNTLERVTIVRPLLRISRTETRAYCVASGLEWRDDPTNLDPGFLRNRVRGHLLPTLRTYNPAVGQALTRAAELLRAEDAWLDGLVDRIWRRVARPIADGVALDVPSLRRQPLAARRRLVRRAAAEAGHASDELGFEAVERTLAMIVGLPPGRSQLSRHLLVTRAGDQLQFHGAPAR